jgi:hypothetical protein
MHGPHGRKAKTEGRKHRETQSSLHSRKSRTQWLAIVGGWDQLRQIHNTETVRPSFSSLRTRMAFTTRPFSVNFSCAINNYNNYIDLVMLIFQFSLLCTVHHEPAIFIYRDCFRFRIVPLMRLRQFIRKTKKGHLDVVGEQIQTLFSWAFQKENNESNN